MAALRLLILSIALCCVAVTTEVQLGRVSQTFALNLYKEVSNQKPHQDLVFSPLSIQISLALLSAGATGETAAQLYNHLGSTNREEVAATFEQLLSKYSTNSPVQIANKVYVMDGSTINPTFNDIATRRYKSEAQTVNFAQNAEASKTINDWVESKTNGNIKNLIPKELLNSMTRMVLVNAIYFKGKWKYPFPHYATELEEFYTSETEHVDIPMMTVEAPFMYAVLENLDATAVELPYDGTDLSMVILLPNNRTGVTDLESNFKVGDLKSAPFRKQKVQVTMPRFKTEFDIQLNDVLKAVGVTKIFADAELNDLLVGDLPLYVSQVVHKAYIDVSEEGTVAAAATGSVVQGRSGRVDWPTYFTADHPFLYLIKDAEGAIYFVGKFVKSN